MGEITLSNGVSTVIDVGKITWGEWTKFFSGKGTHKEDNLFLEKCTGIKADEFDQMLRDDVRRIIKSVLKVGSQPLSDPNSQSASTSPE